jgi:nitrate reductase alpha subunit
MSISRREFIKGSLSVAATAGLPFSLGRPAFAALAERKDRPWEAGYRNLFQGERTVRSINMPNCTGSCAWNVIIKDGIVKRVEQPLDYPDDEYNPRGCMKGATYHRRVYSPNRVKFPMKRVGPRGAGQWKRISWDEALDFIASEIKRIAAKYGQNTIWIYPPVPATGIAKQGAGFRFASVNGFGIGTFYNWYGDLPLAHPITWNVQTEEHEFKDVLNTKYAIIWGSDVAQTRMPDAHFFTDVRAKGVKLVYIAPYYDPTASIVDEWVRVRPGTDGALALGFCHVVVKRGLTDEAHLRRTTSGPLAGAQRQWQVPQGSRPGGGWRCEGVHGLRPEGGQGCAGRVLQRQTGTYGHLGHHSQGWQEGQLLDGPHAASEKAGRLRSGQDRLGNHRGASQGYRTHRGRICIGQACQYLGRHRHQPLVPRRPDRSRNDRAGLPDRQRRRPGGGVSPWAGQYLMRLNPTDYFFPKKEGGKPDERYRAVPLDTAYVVNGPTDTMANKDKLWRQIRCIWAAGGNLLGEASDQSNLTRKVLPQIELIVSPEIEMSTTAQLADIVLPVVSWFELPYDIATTPAHPYIQLHEGGLEPMFEAKTDIWIYYEMCKRLGPATSSSSTALRKPFELLLETGGPQVKGITFERLKKERCIRVNLPSSPYASFTEEIEGKKKFKTASGRQELYKDEDRFIQYRRATAGAQGATPGHALWPIEGVEAEAKKERNPALRKVSDGVSRTAHPLERAFVVAHHDDDNQTRRYRPTAAGAQSGRCCSSAGWSPGTGQRPTTRTVTSRPRSSCANRCRLELYSSISAGSANRLREGHWNALTHNDINPIHEIYFIPNVWGPVSGHFDQLCEVKKS